MWNHNDFKIKKKNKIEKSFCKKKDKEKDKDKLIYKSKSQKLRREIRD